MDKVTLLKKFSYKELRAMEVIRQGDLSTIGKEIYPFNTQDYKKAKKALSGQLDDDRAYIELWKIAEPRFKAIGRDFRIFLESNLKQEEISVV